MDLFEDNQNEFDEVRTPYSIEAEEALLGSIFIKPEVIGEVIEVVRPDDFYKNNYKKIYNEMLGIYNDGIIIDTLIVINKLKQKKLLEEIGGENIIYDLLEVVPTAANALRYAQIIKERSIRRNLIDTGEKITQMAYRGYYEIDRMLDKAEKMIFEIAEAKGKKNVISLNELLSNKVKGLDEISMNKGQLRGISSGFKEYDKITSGFNDSELLILAARPAMGKTAFALNLALNIAKKDKHILIFSLEMGNEQLVERLISIESKIKLKNIKDGTLSDEDYAKLGNAIGKLSELPISISDSSSVNIQEIKAIARREKSDNKLDFLLIDYLQLINSPEGSKKNREQEISEISRSLKIIAKELNIPVIALSQLSRSVESRVDKRPLLSDLRESGAIEQDADMVMFLYREMYYKKNNENNDTNNSVPSQYTSKNNNQNPDIERVEVIIGKHRSGPTGTVHLGFRPDYQQFVNIDEDDQW